MRFTRFMRVLSIMGRAAFYQLTGNRQKLSECLYEGFKSLGGIYIKFLQLMMLRSDIFEPWHSVEHLRIFEDVATEPLDIESLLEAELGAERRQIRLESTTPFTGGSFGQVYHAKLADGTAIIVKALRPSLVKYLSFDLWLIGRAVKFLIMIKPDAMIDLRSVYEYFRETTYGETNYLHEAAFGMTLYERYKDHLQLVIPKTYQEYSTKQILVQDYVGGVSASNLLELGRQGKDINKFVRDKIGSDLNQQMEMLGFELLYAVFSGYDNQGDPHPGNVKILADNKVGLIDFGIVCPPPADRLTALDLFKEHQKIYAGNFDIRSFSATLMRFYAADLVAAINSLDAVGENGKHRAGVIEEISSSAERTFSSRKNRATIEQLIDRGRFTAVFGKIVNQNNRFGLRLKNDSPNFLRAVQMFIILAEGFQCKLAIMPNVFERVITQVEAEQDFADNIEQNPDINRALEIVAAWLDRVSSKDPILFNRLCKHIKPPPGVAANV